MSETIKTDSEPEEDDISQIMGEDPLNDQEDVKVPGSDIEDEVFEELEKEKLLEDSQGDTVYGKGKKNEATEIRSHEEELKELSKIVKEKLKNLKIEQKKLLHQQKSIEKEQKELRGKKPKNVAI